MQVLAAVSAPVPEQRQTARPKASQVRAPQMLRKLLSSGAGFTAYQLATDSTATA